MYVYLLYYLLVVSVTEIWPRGTFSIPETTSGCPLFGTGGFNVICTDDESAAEFSTSFHINTLPFLTCLFYCTFSQSSGGRDWPPGSYCVARKGGSCPSGFDEGSVLWDNEDTFNNNIHIGNLPDGVYDCNTRVYYCCRNDSPINVTIALPTATPFVLLRESADGCQQVQDMTVSEEWVLTDDENNLNRNELSGHHPYVEGTTDFKIFYCYYS